MAGYRCPAATSPLPGAVPGTCIHQNALMQGAKEEPDASASGSFPVFVCCAFSQAHKTKRLLSEASWPRLP